MRRHAATSIVWTLAWIIAAVLVLPGSSRAVAQEPEFIAHMPTIFNRQPPIPYTPVLDSINNADRDGTYTLAWNETPEALADEYEVQESTSPDFDENVITACRTASMTCTITGQEADTYYYRVRGLNFFGPSDWSNVERATVGPPEMPTLLEIDNDNRDGDYVVEWTDVDEATSYLLQEDDDADFSSPTPYNLAASSYQANDKQGGIYHYRVAALGPTGQSDWSNTRSVEVAREADVEIIAVFWDGLEAVAEGDEYAELRNLGGQPINLEDWRLVAGDLNRTFTFPEFILQPGQTCRVYTDEVHPDTCGFTFSSPTAIWTNDGDCGYIYSADDVLESLYCYFP